MSEPSPLPDVTHAVRELLPALRGHTRAGWFQIAVVTVLSFLAILFAIAELEGEGKIKIIFIAGLIGALIIGYIARRTRSQHEAAVMPILGHTVGLSHTKDAGHFAKSLPMRLLPHRAITSGEDHLAGRIGDRTLEMAEIKAETGGKNSRTLFQGIVARFPNAVPMPPFFIADEAQTRSGLFFSGHLDVEGLVQVQTISTGGTSYGIWASSAAAVEHPALAEVIRILTNLPSRVSAAAQLFSATSNGEITHVALTHKRNLYQIGGLFFDEAQLLRDVETALRDLTVPLTIAHQLMEAERAVGGAAKSK